MPNQFAISTWTEKSEELIKKIESVFQSIDYPKDELPQTVYDNEKPISASITYLDDSRNQWNRNGVSGYEGGGDIKVGMVIERLDVLDSVGTSVVGCGSTCRTQLFSSFKSYPSIHSIQF